MGKGEKALPQVGQIVGVLLIAIRALVSASFKSVISNLSAGAGFLFTNPA
jgi:hypothetical protein